MAGNYFSNPNPQFSDLNGKPVPGGAVEFFEAGGTTTDQDTFTDKDLTPGNENANPVVLDSDGRAPFAVFLQQLSYNVRLLTAPGGSVIWARDNVSNILQVDLTGLATIATYAAARALVGATLTGGDRFFIESRTADGDGASGVFFWDAASVLTDNDGTILKLTDTTTGRLIRDFSGMVSTEWFGINGDDSTDNTTSIVAATTVATGKQLIFPEGIFLTDPWTIPSNIEIDAAGKGRTIIKSNLTAAATAVMVSAGVVQNVTIKNLTIDCNRTINFANATLTGLRLGDPTPSGSVSSGLDIDVEITGALQHGAQFLRVNDSDFVMDVDDFGIFGVIFFRGCTDNRIDVRAIGTSNATSGSGALVYDDRSSDSTTSEPCTGNTVRSLHAECGGFVFFGHVIEGGSNNTASNVNITDPAESGYVCNSTDADSTPASGCDGNVLTNFVIDGQVKTSGSSASILIEGANNVVSDGHINNGGLHGILMNKPNIASLLNEGNKLSNITMKDIDGSGVQETVGENNHYTNITVDTSNFGFRSVPTDGAILYSMYENCKAIDSVLDGFSIESHVAAGATSDGVQCKHCHSINPDTGDTGNFGFRINKSTQALNDVLFYSNTVTDDRVTPLANAAVRITAGTTNTRVINTQVYGAITGISTAAAAGEITRNYGNEWNPPTWGSATAAADDTTPSVTGITVLNLPANTVPTAITQLDNGIVDQRVVLVVTSSTNASTIADSGNFALSAAFTPNVNDTLTVIFNGTIWRETTRSTN